ILQYKRKRSVFAKEEAELKEELLNVERTVVNFLNSSDFGKILKKNIEKFKKLFQKLSQSKISPKKYFLQLTELISPSKKPKAVKTPKAIKATKTLKKAETTKTIKKAKKVKEHKKVKGDKKAKKGKKIEGDKQIEKDKKAEEDKK
ncbi:MAG: hypothetical protein ACFFD2_25735, partial [Promethearchaeota archaeon]